MGLDDHRRTSWLSKCLGLRDDRGLERLGEPDGPWEPGEGGVKKDDQSAKAATDGDAEEPGFETLIEELDRIVGQLEGGELPLEQSLAAFERGVEVSGHASRILDAAEKRIEVLTGSADAPQTAPFEP